MEFINWGLAEWKDGRYELVATASTLNDIRSVRSEQKPYDKGEFIIVGGTVEFDLNQMVEYNTCWRIEYEAARKVV